MATPKIGWAAYNAKRRDYLAEYYKQYHERNRDKKISVARSWYAENKQIALERQKAYREGKPLTEEQRERKRFKANERKALDPEKYSRLKRYQHLKRRAAGDVALEDCQDLMANPICASCGSDDHIEIDHILPIALGGTSERFNLQLLCRPCNRSKGCKHPDDWKGRRIRLPK